MSLCHILVYSGILNGKSHDRLFCNGHYNRNVLFNTVNNYQDVCLTAAYCSNVTLAVNGCNIIAG